MRLALDFGADFESEDLLAAGKLDADPPSLLVFFRDISVAWIQ